MEGDQPPCTRCERRGIDCVLNKSLQSLLDSSSQTEAMQNDILNLFTTLAEVCNHNNLKPPKPLQIRQTNKTKTHTGHLQEGGYDDENDSCVASRPMSPSDMEAPINGFLEGSDTVDTAPAQVAGGSPYSTHSRKGPSEPDLISSGIISAETGDILVRRYLDRLDHYLYGIGSAYTDLKSLRTSPILLAAVCTISALHDEKRQKVYEACNDEFQRLVSKSLFEIRGLEYLRALCIGSYWLSDASRILNSDALRRAADVRLPKYFYQVTAAIGVNQPTVGDLSMPAKVDRVRLWYLLYICDQHLSILYNRDPIVHGNQDLVLGWETFLESENTSDPDIRICSQAALLQIMSQIRTTCGSSETAEPVPKALTTSFNDYKRQIDRWYFRFSPVFKSNPRMGDFPHKGLTLHYHFSKVYLGHHVFRGLGATNGQLPSYFLATALMAHSASRSIFELLLDDSILKGALVGIPFYFHVMISFAGQFMLSCAPYSGQLGMDAKDDLELMGRAILMFKSLACVAAHPLHRMTSALDKRLQECRGQRASHYRDTNGNIRSNVYQPPLGPDQIQQWKNFQANGNNNIGSQNERLNTGSDSQGDHQMGSAATFQSPIGGPGGNSNSGPNYIPASDTNMADHIESESGTFGMVPLPQSYVMASDALYQDFAGFDFPGFQMNFATGPT